MNKAGITLIETLTSLFIIAILSAIFVTNYRQAGRQSDLQLATQLLIRDIRLAQANALGLVEYAGAMPAGGWGIHFDVSSNQEYIIFADEDSNRSYSVGEGDETLGARLITLPSDIVIDSVGSLDVLNIVFLPPDPLSYINDSFNDGLITLKNLKTNATTTVQVNFAGLIEDI